MLLPKALLQEDRSFNRKELYRSFLADELSKTKIIFFSDMFDMVVLILVNVFLRFAVFSFNFYKKQEPIESSVAEGNTLDFMVFQNKT